MVEAFATEKRLILSEKNFVSKEMCRKTNVSIHFWYCHCQNTMLCLNNILYDYVNRECQVKIRLPLPSKRLYTITKHTKQHKGI